MLSLDRRSSPVAFDVHLEDGRVVNKAVDGSHNLQESAPKETLAELQAFLKG